MSNAAPKPQCRWGKSLSQLYILQKYILWHLWFMISFIIIYQTNNEFLIFRSVRLSKKLSAPERAGEPLSGLQGGKDVLIFSLSFSGWERSFDQELEIERIFGLSRLYTMLTN